MKVLFEMDKVTKNTIRFAEILESSVAAPKIGSAYVPKSTLADMGWKEGMKLVVEISVEE